MADDDVRYDRSVPKFVLRRKVDLPRVMIVDNDHATGSLLQTLLELDGFTVMTVQRGLQALERARVTPPDIFLLDFKLDDMDGTDLARQLRATAQFARTPIVIASGMNVETEAIAAGANMFLVKPFEPSQLAGILNKLIDGSLVDRRSS